MTPDERTARVQFACGHWGTFGVPDCMDVDDVVRQLEKQECPRCKGQKPVPEA